VRSGLIECGWGRAMIEWLILLLLVPAIAVPVVLLVGFAGCGFSASLPVTPVIESAVGKSVSVITLTWTYPGSAAKFEFERKKIPEQTTESFEAVSSPFDDQGLDAPGDIERLLPATTYLYRVRAVFSDGEPSAWSSEVPGTTLPFQTTFEWRSEEQVVARDSAAWEGHCLVQRIEANRLLISGTQVRLTLRASSVGDASIERVFISKPDPAPGSDPYDSPADLTAVTVVPFVVPANTAVILAPVDYVLDVDQPLLMAVDFSAAPPSAIRITDQTPPEQALAYFKLAPNEAPNLDRTDFTSFPGISLIEKIEVG
jgi:hypothetical protein